MAHHGRDEEDHNESRQQPDWTDNERPWKGEVNSTDSKKREKCLPARLGLIETVVLIRHKAAISKIGARANLNAPRIRDRGLHAAAGRQWVSRMKKNQSFPY
jgi:hypothetical protein